ncbi:hypothetical protein Hanom_Chr05g00455021 [Helianthus anomalus]
MAVSTPRTNGPVLRPHSSSGRFHNTLATTSFATTTSAFPSISTFFFQNITSSPTPVNLYGYEQ